MTVHRRVATGLLTLAFGSFVVLGLPDGMLGVAWPSMSASFSVPLGALGVLLTGFTIGYMTATILLGTLVQRFGYAVVLVSSLALLGIAGFLYYLSTGWILLVATASIMGAGAGLLDAGLNAFGAHRFRPRDLNWLHAAYGIGATAGPFVMTPLVISGVGWRWGYLLFAILASTGVLLFARRGSDWTVPAESDSPRSPDSEVRIDGSRCGRRRRVFVLSIVLFFIYTGIEVVAGQWAFSLLTISRGMTAATAGTAVAVFYGSLTAGRVAFGFVSERLAPTPLLRLVLVGVILGTVLIWISSPAFLAPLGLAILGFSLAPIFPTLVGQTPERVGPRFASHMIGIQIAAANLGAVSLVGLTGAGVELLSLEIIGPVLVGTSILFVVLHEILIYQSRSTSGAISSR